MTVACDHTVNDVMAGRIVFETLQAYIFHDNIAVSINFHGVKPIQQSLGVNNHV